MAAVRLKPKPKVDYEKERRELETMKQTGFITGIKLTIKKIKHHGKDNQSATIKQRPTRSL